MRHVSRDHRPHITPESSKDKHSDMYDRKMTRPDRLLDSYFKASFVNHYFFATIFTRLYKI